MRVAIALVVLVVTFAAGASPSRSTLVDTDIASVPFVAALLRAPVPGSIYSRNCAGSILNNRAVLTAGNCLYYDHPSQWSFRVGSNDHDSGGKVYSVSHIALFENFDEWAMRGDIAVVHTGTEIQFGANVQPGIYAGPNYELGVNQAVTAVGWGYISMPSWVPGVYNNLRKHEQTTIAVNVCNEDYFPYGIYLTDTTQICSGFANPASVSPENSRDKCIGEPGAPLIHAGTIVGVRSFAVGCFNHEIQTVSSKVSSFITWIKSNA